MSVPVVVSVAVGRAAELTWRGRTVRSGIVKTPVDGPVTVTPTGVIGDEQADRRHHGGPDKAVLGYAAEHYADWQPVLGDLTVPGFGENLTVRGLLECDTVVGTVYQVGIARLQVTHPRRPCYKLAALHGVDDLAVATQRTGRTGVYFRVLTPGEIRVGDRMTPVERPAHGITAGEVHRVLNIDRDDADGARRLLEHPELLPDGWVRMLQRRLADGAREDQTSRLHGRPVSGLGDDQ